MYEYQKAVKICRKSIFIASCVLETVEVSIILSLIELEKVIFSKICDFNTNC